MNKIRIGTVYPGYIGNYSEMEWVDLDEMNPLDFVDIVKKMLSELRENKPEDEGELVIVPKEFEEE